MKISTKGRYGLRALVDMAANVQEGPISLIQIATRQDISLNYLEQVFGVLRKAGIVRSIKGAGGGYMLERNTETITVKEILDALEGEFSIIDRDSKEMQDPIQKVIREMIWEKIDTNVNEFLASRTLKQLVQEYKENLDFNANMYYI